MDMPALVRLCPLIELDLRLHLGSKRGYTARNELYNHLLSKKVVCLWYVAEESDAESS